MERKAVPGMESTVQEAYPFVSVVAAMPLFGGAL
jgi:hypothetical protein